MNKTFLKIALETIKSLIVNVFLFNRSNFLKLNINQCQRAKVFSYRLCFVKKNIFKMNLLDSY